MKNVVALAIAGLLLSLPAAATQSEVGGAIAKSAAGRVDLKIVIPEVLKLRVMRAPTHVEVTPEDVQRGYVAVSGYEIEIDANLRAGYSVLARLAGGPFTAAEVSGLSAPLRVAGSEGSAWIPYSRNHHQQMQVSYRLELQPGAAPGRYASPVSLALAAS
jgi:hypothetical protein